MKQYTTAVFEKGQWLEAYRWQNARVAEGYDFIATTYANGQTVKIATKESLSPQEQQQIAKTLIVA